MRRLTWILCFPALEAADVKLSISTTSLATKLMVDGKDTGCTSKTTSQDLTCKFPDSDSSVGQVPATYFSAVIDCTNMDASAFDSLTIQPLSQCAKMTFTQHMKKGGHVNLEALQMVPNSVANFTCVAFPFKAFGTRINEDGWSKLPVNVSITGIKNGQEDKVSTWTMGSVRFHVQDSTGGKTLALSTCMWAVEENFLWGLSLLKSSHNVHELLWTSQAKKPNIDHIAAKINTYDFKVTKTMKNVAFNDLDPKILYAFVDSYGKTRNFKEHVKLKKLEPAGQGQPEKHEEKLELSVDATQLPKGTKALEVTVTLEYPTTGYAEVELMLPVDSPEVPDENPEKSGGVGAGVVAFIIIAGLVFLAGAFLYRRHQRIQAIREVVL
eukprot:Skav214140  [mRNA]  locus=scaffold1645:117355:118500:- [translate_table: standard]